MSANSGIGVSQELLSVFSSAVDVKNVRFIKVVIQNESLVPTETIPTSDSSSLQDDLPKLQDILEETTPAFVLAKLDDPPVDWLAIYYVPEGAKVRDKMLYASTRASLLKPLGSHLFSDSLFATSKDDVTPEAYAAHRKHISAPKPLSAREQEMADIRAAERASEVNTYEGSRTRTSIVSTVGLGWAAEVEDAIKSLGEEREEKLLLLQIETSTETLTLVSFEPTPITSLSESLLPSEPCYGFFLWPSQGKIIFIYCCPSSSTIKHRMLYSSAARAIHFHAKSLLPPGTLAERKIETSDPKEVTEDLLKFEYVTPMTGESAAMPIVEEAKKPFARPKGPGRRK